MAPVGIAPSRLVIALVTVAALSACTGEQDPGLLPGGAETEKAVAATGSGIGDPYYPDDGNVGYQVTSYRVKLDYFRSDQHIDAKTTVTARATAALRRFNLDLVGFDVEAVRVNGAPASFARRGAHELVIKPAAPVASSARFVTVVRYSGKPGRDPLPGVPSGWYDARTPGAGFIAGEPHSCTLWYPCNDHPTDKATFEVRATVPRPFEAVSNGAELPVTAGIRDGVRVRTFHWKLTEATATYLTTIYIDKLTFERSTLVDGTPVVSAYGPHPGSAPSREALLPEILGVLADHWGPYPAPQAGGIFVSGEVPFSLETYTRPIYTEDADVPTIVHENAHQWWGDNISLVRWRDICFNECLASYSEWLWYEHEGTDLDQTYLDGVGADPTWFDVPLYDMGAGNEFVYQGVYLKGAYFVHALRNLIGDDEFFAAMTGIQAERGGGNMSMLDLRDTLADATGVDLTSFWQEWVLSTGTPSDANLYPGDLAG
jgi:aminopeptidase N